MDDVKNINLNEMSDDLPDQKVILSIIITKEGDIKVAGAIQDKTLALGLLENAKLVLIKHWESLEVKLHKPNRGIMDFVRHKRN